MVIKIRMRPKQLAAILLSTCLVLALVLSACGTDTTTTPATTSNPTTSTPSTSTPATQVVEKQVDKVYRVLNPQGIPTQVVCSSLAPRLDSLAGKKILYYISEAGTGQQMPYLLEMLKAEYPTATFDVIETSQFGHETPTEEHLTYDACIRGNAW